MDGRFSQTCCASSRRLFRSLCGRGRGRGGVWVGVAANLWLNCVVGARPGTTVVSVSHILAALVIEARQLL